MYTYITIYIYIYNVYCLSLRRGWRCARRSARDATRQAQHAARCSARRGSPASESLCESEREKTPISLMRRQRERRRRPTPHTNTQWATKFQRHSSISWTFGGSKLIGACSGCCARRCARRRRVVSWSRSTGCIATSHPLPSRAQRTTVAHSSEQRQFGPATANLPTNSLDFRGCDSSRILILRGGVLMSIGNFPVNLSQILLGIILVGGLGVQHSRLP